MPWQGKLQLVVRVTDGLDKGTIDRVEDLLTTDDWELLERVMNRLASYADEVIDEELPI